MCHSCRGGAEKKLLKLSCKVTRSSVCCQTADYDCHTILRPYRSLFQPLTNQITNAFDHEYTANQGLLS